MEELKQIFPQFSDSYITNALQISEGNLEIAISLLLAENETRFDRELVRQIYADSDSNRTPEETERVILKRYSKAQARTILAAATTTRTESSRNFEVPRKIFESMRSFFHRRPSMQKEVSTAPLLVNDYLSDYPMNSEGDVTTTNPLIYNNGGRM